MTQSDFYVVFDAEIRGGKVRTVKARRLTQTTPSCDLSPTSQSPSRTAGGPPRRARSSQRNPRRGSEQAP